MDADCLAQSEETTHTSIRPIKKEQKQPFLCFYSLLQTIKSIAELVYNFFL